MLTLNNQQKKQGFTGLDDLPVTWEAFSGCSHVNGVLGPPQNLCEIVPVMSVEQGVTYILGNGGTTRLSSPKICLPPVLTRSYIVHH